MGCEAHIIFGSKARGTNPKDGCANLISQQLHENERIRTERGAHIHFVWSYRNHCRFHQEQGSIAVEAPIPIIASLTKFNGQLYLGIQFAGEWLICSQVTLRLVIILEAYRRYKNQLVRDPHQLR